MRESINFKATTFEWLIHKSGMVKESTLAKYRSIIRAVMKEFGTQLPLNSISTDLLYIIGENFLNKYNQRTVKLYALTINQVLKFAYDSVRYIR